MEKDTKDSILVLLSTASYMCKKKGSNLRHDAQDEVAKLYKYFAMYMEPIAAVQLTVETAKFKRENPNKSLESISEALCTEHGYLRCMIETKD